MTVNHEIILNYLRKHYGEEVTKAQIVEDTGVPMSSVTRAVIDWRDKGYLLDRPEETIVILQNGKEKPKTIHHVQLNEAGLSWTPDAK